MTSSTTEQVKSVLMVDIVGFSKKHFAKDMKSAVKNLCKLLHEAIPDGHDREEYRIWSPAGDGGALTFTDIWDAYYTAVNLSQLVNECNEKSRRDKPILQVRMGLHAGIVVQAKDFDRRDNVWGHGINIASRMLGAAQPGQILVSEWYHDLLDNPTHTENERVFCKFGRWWFKHNMSINLYNMYFAVNDKSIVGIETGVAENWYRPYAYPVNQAIQTYYGMFEDHINENSLSPFHALLLAKRLIDLLPEEKIETAIGEDLQKKLQRQQHSVFSELPYEDLWILLKHSEVREYNSPETIKLERSDEYLLSVIFGKVNVECSGAEVRELTEGESCTNIGLATEDRTQHTVTVTARSALLFLNITREERENQFSLLKKHLWKLQAQQIKEQALTSFPIFKALTRRDYQELLADARVYPEQYDRTVNEEIPANPNLMWDSWFYVFRGEFTIMAECSPRDERDIKYGHNRIMGTLRLHLTLHPIDFNNPRLQYKIASYDTILVVFSWKSIERCLERNPSFRGLCEAYYESDESWRWNGTYD